MEFGLQKDTLQEMFLPAVGSLQLVVAISLYILDGKEVASLSVTCKIKGFVTVLLIMKENKKMS